MKADRQSLILEIISEADIETQNQLMEKLLDRGIKSTQATLSRDIKELRLIKELSPQGVYRYTVPPRDESADHDNKLRKIFRECVVRVDKAQNLIVIHTLPGLANAAASAIDNMADESVAGTIAGDDTVFLAMRTNMEAERFFRELEDME